MASKPLNPKTRMRLRQAAEGRPAAPPAPKKSAPQADLALCARAGRRVGDHSGRGVLLALSFEFARCEHAARPWALAGHHPAGRSGAPDRAPRPDPGRDGAGGGASEICARCLHRHRGSPLPRSSWRRSHRTGARRDREHGGRPCRAGRLDADAAARQEPVPRSRPHLRAQAPGSDARGLSGVALFQGPDTDALSQSRLFRRRRHRYRGGVRALLQQTCERADASGSRHAGRQREGADEIQSAH